MLIMNERGRLRRAVAIVLMVLVALVMAPAFGFMLGDGPLISCDLCYESYPDWWCHYVWFCPWPGGGGGSGAH